MIPEQLKLHERAFKKAIEQRQYNDLIRCLEKMRRVADDHMSKLPPRDPRRREIAAWMLATLERGRLLVATYRQACVDELDRLPKVGLFLDGSGSRDSGFCMDL